MYTTNSCLLDAAVLQRCALISGRGHEGFVCDAQAGNELAHVEPAQAAPKARALRVLGQALQLFDRRG
jgi:hypothetical protein